jgi:hypothetical protein
MIHTNILLIGQIDAQNDETYDAAIPVCRIFDALNAARGRMREKYCMDVSRPICSPNSYLQIPNVILEIV